MKLTEKHLKKMIKEAINEINGWSLEKEDWVDINSDQSESYNKCFSVRIWTGKGYYLPAYKVYANNEEEALEICVAWLEKNEPDMLKDDWYQEELEDGEDEEILDSRYVYVDATMEGASEPHYILADNLRIDELPQQTQENKLRNTIRKYVRESIQRINENEEYNPWLNGDASYFNDTFDIKGYHVTIDTKYSTVEIIIDDSEEYFLQGYEADDLIKEICQYWNDNECTQKEAIFQILNNKF